jgi:hypothetical protein
MAKSLRHTIETLNAMLTQANAAPPAEEPTGACRYDPGDGTIVCADGLTEGQCALLSGDWAEGQLCAHPLSAKGKS